jgi:NAD dependent epimerase/dehydratase
MKLTGKKVLVTGACGFIGSHLCEALVEKNCDVTALVYYNSWGTIGNLAFMPKQKRDQIKIIFGNVEDFHFMQSQTKNIEVVFHLAALIGIPYSYVAPLSYVKTNVEGTLSVLEAVRTNQIEKLIHTSTSETYGSALYTPIDEAHPLQGQSPYSASKIGADKLVESYFKSFNLPVTTLRPFNTFGPRQSTRAIIPTIIAQALNKNTISLGSLSPIRDLNYVSDTVDAFIKIAESDQALGEVINAGHGKGISIAELCQKIFQLLDKNIEIQTDAQRVRPEKSEVHTLICNNQKAKQIINWAPQVDLTKGLVNTIEFIKGHPELFDNSRYGV